MDSYFSNLCSIAPHAHWIIFSLLLLGGLNLPVSEDFLVLAGGAIAATCIPDHAIKLYFWVFFGCYLSAWEAYWIGRLLGPRLFDLSFFRSVITPKRLEKLRYYLAKFGIFVFIIGRFCPGGVRNALFMSSGLTKMPFYFFILKDGLGCAIFTMTIFSIGYHFGKHFNLLIRYLTEYEYLFLALLTAGILFALIYFRYRQKEK